MHVNFVPVSATFDDIVRIHVESFFSKCAPAAQLVLIEL